MMSKATEFFLNHIAQTSPYPLKLEVERAKGVYFFSKAGQKYFDFTSGIAVSNLGHQNKAIIKAIKAQAGKHLHTMVFGEFVESPQLELAKALTELLPNSLDCVYYCTSGSEAVEAAMKLAKRKTERAEIISCIGSYHGSTHGALSIMGSEKFKQAYRPLLPNTRLIRYNNLGDLSFVTDKTAGVIVEVVQAASGVTLASQEWLRKLKVRCEEVGALLIFDEVQTGFGRTGKFFAFEHYDTVPDLLLLAKAMGGGVPIGALIGKKELVNLFSVNPILGHINTFGGNSLACAASLAMIQELNKKSTLLEEVEDKAELIKSLMVHQKIKKISNKGLLMALHFEEKTIAQKFINYSLEEGVVLIGFLLNDDAVRLAPPLTISKKQIEKACKKMRRALDNLN